MGRRAAVSVVLLVLGSACSQVLGLEPLDFGGVGAGADASPPGEGGLSDSPPSSDARAPTSCNRTRPFGVPRPAPISFSGQIGSARFSADERVFFGHAAAVGTANVDIYTGSRPDRDAVLQLQRISTLSTNANDEFPSMSADRDRVVFHRDAQILIANLLPDGGIATPRGLVTGTHPYLSRDGKTMVFANGFKLYQAAIRDDQTIATPVPIPPFDQSSEWAAPVITDDQLTIFVARVTLLQAKVYTATRPSLNDPFGPPTPVAELNTGSDIFDYPTWISPDACRIYISSSRSGAFGVLLAERPPE